MPNKTLIYGSSGFLGKNFELELENRNLPFFSISRSNLEMSNISTVKRFLESQEFDSIFFSIGPAPCRTPEMFIENIELILNLLQAIRIANLKPKITYISSDAVYGSINANPRTESTQTIPDTLHGKMHLVREMLLHSADLPILILRCSAIFGIGDRHLSYGPNRFFNELTENRTLSIYGSGSDKRDHVWINDFARVAADLHGTSEGTFNLVSGKSISFLDIADEMQRLSGKSNLISCQSSDSSFSEIHYDNSKLLEKLGYKIEDSLARGLVSYFHD